MRIEIPAHQDQKYAPLHADNEAINVTNALFLLSQTQDKQKEYFMKLVAQ